MELPKLDWKSFTGRRRLDVKKWLENKDFEKYSDLVSWCADKGILPPEKKEVDKFFAKPKNLKKPKVIKKEKIEEKTEEKLEKEVEKPKVRKKKVEKKEVDKTVE